MLNIIDFEEIPPIQPPIPLISMGLAPKQALRAPSAPYHPTIGTQLDERERFIPGILGYYKDMMKCDCLLSESNL